MAEGWYHRRHWTRFRRELEEMAARWQRGRLLNVGCAHGPDFLPFRDGFELWGLDSSSEMLRFALKYRGKHGFEAGLVLGDARWLPYADNAFDWAIAVAAYHNIRGHEGRMRAFAELRRVLRPGGEAFITVWNRWQPRFWLGGKEVLVPWKTRGSTVRRYYYLFSRRELVGCLERSGLEVMRVFPGEGYHFPMAAFSRNICVLVRKRAGEHGSCCQ
ncbi:MAG: class I SAM-dependent methyltransferase [Chloroflexota bacterium]